MNRKRSTYPLVLIVLTIIFSGSFHSAAAQVSPDFIQYPQNHLDWFTLQTDHFQIHFQQGNSRSAQAVAQAAEQVYYPITGLYDYEPPRKTSIVIRDREDYSNGAAFFFDNKIEIWLPSLDTPLRGTHSWIENVVAHEFTHMIQLGASMKRSQKFPAIYFQWLSYENVRRPDVLYGFPNGIVTLPFSAVNIPAWFAEGTAQYQRETMNYDTWDSHRDMLLRTRILDNNQLTFEEMSLFTSKNSLERELVYNHGFSFTSYLADNYGENILSKISNEASETGNINISEAIESATGTKADRLYSEWISDKKQLYSRLESHLDLTITLPVEEKGFLNFYPQFSSDGSRFAYLSNRGRDFSRTALLLFNDDELQEVDEMGRPAELNQSGSYSALHGLASPFSIDFIGNRFSFSPDGSKIVYSRAEKNRYGEMYKDLYIYDIADRQSQKITSDERVQDPVWNPDGSLIAAVRQRDGTQNLILLRSDGSVQQQITDFNLWETIYTPVWHPDGSELFFAAASEGNRNIFKITEPFENIHPVFSDPDIDFRDPWVDSTGQYLYFSSDENGIFNIFRHNFTTGNTEKLTELSGGAFMPFVHNDELYFSEYLSEGYKISKIPLSESGNQRVHFFDNSGPDIELLQNQTRVQFQELDYSALRDTGESLEVPGPPGYESSMSWQKYSDTTTGLSVFPVIRFDNYTKLKGSNRTLLLNGEFGQVGENLVRDVKFGVYLSSRDVTEKLSIFAGALIGPGSIPADGLTDFLSPNRINNLDRDLFLIVEHRGLPFIKKSWSPTVSVELYNLKRNVGDGITIEEFACTSCLPEERFIDIRYSVWEAALWLRSKLNRWSLLELGASYTPYSVQTEGFFSNEFNEFIPGSTSQYFRGTSYTASYIASLFEPYRHSDIAPKGIGGKITYRVQPGSLLREFDVEDGILTPIYQKEVNQSFELSMRYGFGLTENTTGMLNGRGFTYLNSPSDYFYLDYNGGLAGMRSYPFFAIGGQKTVHLTGSVITPLYSNIYKQAGSNTIDKVFARFFIETGNGWGGPLNIGNNLKTGAGAELRIAFSRSYLFPMKLFLNGTYGFNRFDVSLPSEFITTGKGNTTLYGQEFLFYLGLTFDFDAL